MVSHGDVLVTKKAREKLNFKPEISLTEGLRRTIEWYTAQ